MFHFKECIPSNLSTKQEIVILPSQPAVATCLEKQAEYILYLE